MLCVSLLILITGQRIKAWFRHFPALALLTTELLTNLILRKEKHFPAVSSHNKNVHRLQQAITKKHFVYCVQKAKSQLGLMRVPQKKKKKGKSRNTKFSATLQNCTGSCYCVYVFTHLTCKQLINRHLCFANTLSQDVQLQSCKL